MENKINKEKLRKWLDIIYKYELSHGKDPLLRKRAAFKEIQEYYRRLR